MKNSWIKLSQSTVLFSLFLESPDFEVQFDGIIGNKSVKSANLWQSSTELPGVC